jgi:hypothetical protein
MMKHESAVKKILAFNTTFYFAFCRCPIVLWPLAMGWRGGSAVPVEHLPLPGGTVVLGHVEPDFA